MPRVLLVDDDVELLELLSEYLQQEGFSVELAHDGLSGAQAALGGQFDIAVIDVMMPQMNGIEALRKIRTLSNLPVILLTAMGDDADRIIGLELGADDYVPKPSSAREITARIRAILRRSQGLANDTLSGIKVGELELWPTQRRAQWAGKPLELTSTEYSLLEVLAQFAGRPVSKDQLSQQALGRPLAKFDRSIDVHLSSIRHKLGTLPDGRSCIQTVFRQGYQLIRDL
ncbi:response regulator transcription factor [Chitinibacter bivalviorum]|uniref:Response regulator transcription factor n=1 Tax=Chitinibacter bivalviorum TaxID=2739434 RepID=A0A7H9BJR0_9NEIS|nr:response regulator transcription factor [Chitinibacter bivalviorum]QLG88915.1 response regulator transcription factor [Chitinibacter bivalviorum]